MQDPTRTMLEGKATAVRRAVLDMVAVAGTGHYGPSFSVAEILVSLYYGTLDVRPEEPDWPARDRLVLSKGHACCALYAILADLGYFDRSHLDEFTRLGSILGDHPDHLKVPGIDFSSGSLGHGLSVATGMAEALRLQGHGSRVIAIVGDGEQNEGQIWEAAGYAGFRRLSNLLVICDRNEVCVDGRTEDIMSVEPMADRWGAFGFHVAEVDGHDLDALREAYADFDRRRAVAGAPPTMLIAHTVSGKGVDFLEADAAWHLGYLHGEDHDEAVRQVDAMYPPADAGVPA